MATFKPIAINRTGVNLPYAEGQFIVATQPFTNGSERYLAGVYVDMEGKRQQLTTQGPKGDTGDTGATGATGAPGQAATIRIGKVTTGAPGSPAQVSNSGTEQNVVLDIVIPTGEEGPQGKQGASWFHTMAPSGVTLQISSLQPQLTPGVGDAVFFPNGDVRQIISVSGSTVTLGGVLFSFKGDPGIGNATLSNIDGDSEEDGFTQHAVKTVAQAKNYYNLSLYDSGVSNSNGTTTVLRKTLIDEDGTQSLLPTQYQYEEIVPDNQPIHIANKQECLYWHKEFRKGLNLFDDVHPVSNSEQNVSWTIANDKIRVVSTTNNDTVKYVSFYCNLKPNRTYTLTISPSNSNYGYTRIYENNNGSLGSFVKEVSLSGSFTITDKTEFFLLIYLKNNTPLSSLTEVNVMLNEGNIPYPYEPKYGRIVREKDLSGIQLFPEGINPAQTIGGDWEDLGLVTVGSTTLHAYQKVNGGQ